jgi:anthraniloyl-CoA monooxygenase
MRVTCIGGGPGGLYTAILMKRAFPEAHVTVHERNRPGDTFGWGVVFSDETLGGFQEADPESFAAITEAFAYWSDIETFQGGECVRSTGHGFCGMSRKRLLEIFHDRCRELGVELLFESEVRDDADLEPADLIVAADGLHSVVREKYAQEFKPDLDWRRCKFAWLGTTKPLETFTFIFKRNEHGLFQVHAYPFERGETTRSTWIVECTEQTWRRAGLDQADEQATVEYCERLFAEDLDGHRLLTNKSIWRTFPTVRNERWSTGKVVLVGDAAHTAHFSIGSGTKLAMEDAIALVAACREHGLDDVPATLAAYEDARRVDTLKLQKTAQTSLEWFENSERYVDQAPLQFSFNLLTRSKRITYDNLALRDPALVENVRRWWISEQGADPERVRAPMFAPLKLAGLTLPNRVVVSPMCQYSAREGLVGDWHLMHLGARAVGGAGLVLAEMTDVSAEGRITPGCAGIYDDGHVAAWRRVTDFVHEHSGAAIGLQLGHAGRKASCSLPWEGDAPLSKGDGWGTIGPSADAFGPGWPTPRPMDRGDMERVIAQYVAATERALAAGFDLLEVHMAHGYLLSSFISPAANRRQDEYGGSLAGRMRFPLEVFEAVRAAWPAAKPLAVRVSATDWLPEGGTTIEDTLELTRALQERGLDLIDVSTAGNTPESEPNYGRMYQVPFAERLRHETGVKTMAVGAIQGWDHVNTILAAGRADLCALARPHLLDPHLTLRAAVEYGQEDLDWPKPYLAVQPSPSN